MKKMTFLLLLVLAGPAQAGSVQFSTYYPAPFGMYDRLRLVPRANLDAQLPCDPGTMYINADAGNQLEVCNTAGDDWAPLSGGPWTQDVNDVYVTDTTANVGIGTTTPRTRLELGDDGAILATGTFGSGWTEPNLGAGTRFIWYPRKAAFRAGGAPAAQWDDTNIGNYSVAFGYNNTANGNYSAIGGGFNSFASEEGSTVSGGRENIASGGYSTVGGGYINRATMAETTVAGGWMNTANGNYSTVGGGVSNTAGGGGGSVVSGGSYNTASGTYSAIPGGNYNTASGYASFAMGNYATAQAAYSTVIGQYNIVSGDAGAWIATDPLFVVGNGTSAVSASNAMTVLKNGNVGIGTTTPNSKLNVVDNTLAGTVLEVSNGDITPGVSIMDLRSGPALYSYGNNYVQWRNLAGNTWLFGDGDTERVGIGTTAPGAKLDVAGSIKIADGTQGAGKVLTSDASGVASWQTAAAHGKQRFTSSGTFTVPVGVTTVWVTMSGGGGGGGGDGRSGGGGGGTVIAKSCAVTPEDIISVTVGAGGNAGLALGTNGGNGGNSVFTGCYTVSGGSGGSSGYSSGGSGGGEGVSGGFGRPGGEDGGDSVFGGAGLGTGCSGMDGSGYGGGGGGGDTGCSGGAGTPGFVLVEW